MARLVNRVALRTRARLLSNTTGDPNLTDVTLNELANLHIPLLWEKMIAAGPADYLSREATFTTTPGTRSYSLTTYAPDFMSLTGVFSQESTDRLVPIDPVQHRERARFRAPTGAWTVLFEYIPCAPVLSDDVTEFNAVNGWDELISATMARDVLIGRNGDLSVVMAIIAAANARIKSAASPRDRGGVKLVADVEGGQFWPRTARLDGYRLREDNLELYESVAGWP